MANVVGVAEFGSSWRRSENCAHNARDIFMAWYTPTQGYARHRTGRTSRTYLERQKTAPQTQNSCLWKKLHLWWFDCSKVKVEGTPVCLFIFQLLFYGLVVSRRHRSFCNQVKVKNFVISCHSRKFLNAWQLQGTIVAITITCHTYHFLQISLLFALPLSCNFLKD